MSDENILNQRQNLSEEIDWHERDFYLDSNHWTTHPLFASRERHWLHNDMQSIRFYSELFSYVKNKPYRENANVLIAPIGVGKDYYYLNNVFKSIQNIEGIDISAMSLAFCPRNIITKKADILYSGYLDQAFDVIICSQFLHHVHAVGFVPFINEFHRILKKGGTLAILEPSKLYPFGILTAVARKAMGNVTGLVKGERPIYPNHLTEVIAKAGFEKVRVRGIVFSHIRFPLFLQHIIDVIDFPFRVLYPFKLFANSIGWFAQKK